LILHAAVEELQHMQDMIGNLHSGFCEAAAQRGISIPANNPFKPN